ncbi:MAG: hypothetical protein ACR2GY_10800 [Phycisphaerales bacterium]
MAVHFRMMLFTIPPVIFLLLVGTAVCAGVWLLVRLVFYKPVAAPCCARCRYPIERLTRPVCPECGGELNVMGY